LDLLDPKSLSQLAIEADRLLPDAPDDNRLGADVVSRELFDLVARKFRGLKLLSLRGSSLMDDEAIGTLCPALASLRSMDLGASEITDDGLQNVLSAAPALDRLVIRRCKATVKLLGLVNQHPAIGSLHLFSIPKISIASLLKLGESTTLRSLRVYAVEFIPESRPEGWLDTRLMRQVKGLLFERRGILVEFFNRADVWSTVNLDV
jgi:hypothetical protein